MEIENAAILTNTRLNVRPGGKVIIRDNVTIDQNNSVFTVAGELSAGNNFSLENITGLTVTSNAVLSVSPGALITVSPSSRRIHEIYNYGLMQLNGTFNNPITIRGAQQTAGSWDGVRIASTNAAFSYLEHVNIQHAKRGVLLSATEFINLNNVSVSNATLDGIMVNGSSDINISSSELIDNSSYGINIIGSQINFNANTVSGTGSLNPNGVHIGTGLRVTGFGDISGLNNAFTNNQKYGFEASNNSYFTSDFSNYFGNQDYQAYLNDNSNGSAMFSWWGEYPPSSSNWSVNSGSSLSTFHPASFPYNFSVIVDESPILVTSENQMDRETESIREIWYEKYRMNPTEAISWLENNRGNRSILPASENHLDLFWLDILLLEAYTRQELWQDASQLAKELITDNISDEQRIEVKRRMFFVHTLHRPNATAAMHKYKLLHELKDPQATLGVYDHFLTYLPETDRGAIAENILQDKNDVDVTVSNYPNPFNPVTTIHFELPQTSDVSLQVFDMLGRQIAQLINDTKNAGSHQAVFDGTNLSSGMYLYRLRIDDTTITNTMLLIK